MSLNRNLNGLGLGIKKEGVEREELGKAMQYWPVISTFLSCAAESYDLLLN